MSSKYDALWQYVEKLEGETHTLSFSEAAQVLGFPVDHSLLRYKKDLLSYGWKVGKISLKQERIQFSRTKEQEPC